MCFNAGTQWLLWKYESDSTLGDALGGGLGAFPECLAPYILRGNGCVCKSQASTFCEPYLPCFRNLPTNDLTIHPACYVASW